MGNCEFQHSIPIHEEIDRAALVGEDPVLVVFRNKDGDVRLLTCYSPAATIHFLRWLAFCWTDFLVGH